MICKICGDELISNDNWFPSYEKIGNPVCKQCCKDRRPKYNKSTDYNPTKDWMKKNTSCSWYLGVYIAEGVLSKIFKNVERMPYNHKGYDFICNKGKKVDVKSSCQRANGGWSFVTAKNKIADYFLCITYDNRDDLNPQHLWLLPSSVGRDKQTITICESTLSKWSEYELDINKVVEYCGNN